FVVPIVIYSQRIADFPNSPAITEFIHDDFARQVLEPSFAIADMQRPFLAPPSLPPERMDELRTAFAATIKDPAMQEEAARAHLSLNYVSGDQLAQTIKRNYELPSGALDVARKAMGNTF